MIGMTIVGVMTIVSLIAAVGLIGMFTYWAFQEKKWGNVVFGVFTLVYLIGICLMMFNI